MKRTETPKVLMKRAIGVVADQIEADAVRFGLAAVRNEALPDRVLEQMDDSVMRRAIEQILDDDRAFGTQTASSNYGSIVVLVVFVGLVGLVMFVAGRNFLRPS